VTAGTTAARSFCSWTALADAVGGGVAYAARVMSPPAEEPLDRLPESIELTRAEAGRLFGAVDDAVDVLSPGAVRDELQAVKRMMIARLSPWLGGILDEGSEE
jgi:hypothetical protein